jgi:signal peptidase I
MTASFLALLAVVVYAYASGYRIVTVHGASMGDSVPLGSVVLGKTRPPDQVRVGDVILIREQREDGTVATPKIHRVINLYLRGQSVAVQTKGDSNPDPDPTEYLLGEETLVVEGHVPRLGYWISFAATPLGWALSVAVPLTTTVLIGLISLWRRKPAKRRRR